MIFGLAGKSCSGKNEVARILESRGWKTLDMDLMAHQVLEELAGEAAGLFGSGILSSDGGVDRQVLGRIVFSDPRQLARLEELIYPVLHRKLEEEIAGLPAGGPPLVVNAAALQKGDFWRRCDGIIWVAAPWPVRLLRAAGRDGRSLTDLLRRFRSQKELKPQYFFSRVDTYTITNAGSRKGLNRRVQHWIQSLSLE